MRVKAGARAAAFVAAALALATGPSARAHPELSALGTNRYVTAAVLDGRVDVTDALLEGALTGGDERRRFDTDGDGRVSSSELETARQRLRAEGPAVTVSVDERVLPAAVEVSIDLGAEPSATEGPLVVERRQSLVGVLPPGSHRLRLVVTREPPRLLETEVGVVLAPGAALRRGPDRVRFSGPRVSTLEERAATFLIETSAPKPPGRRPPVAVVFAGVALAAVALASVARRRRARRSAR